MFYINFGLVAAISLSFSSNFSHTLGTAKKIVGLAQFNVYTNVPAKASGLAKYNSWPAKICEIKSTLRPAICESGK